MYLNHLTHLTRHHLPHNPLLPRTDHEDDRFDFDRDFDRDFDLARSLYRSEGDGASQQTVLMLFTLFGILVTLFLILVLVLIQTWAVWKVARVVVAAEEGEEAEEEDDVGKGQGEEVVKRRMRIRGCEGLLRALRVKGRRGKEPGEEKERFA